MMQALQGRPLGAAGSSSPPEGAASCPGWAGERGRAGGLLSPAGRWRRLVGSGESPGVRCSPRSGLPSHVQPAAVPAAAAAAPAPPPAAAAPPPPPPSPGAAGRPGFAAATTATATDAELTCNKSTIATQCQSYASAGLTHAADARKLAWI